MAHSFIPLSFVPDQISSVSSTHATVTTSAITGHVDLATGSVTTGVEPGIYRQTKPLDPSQALVGLRETCQETDQGPRTEVAYPNEPPTRLDGEITAAWSSGRFVVAALSDPRAGATLVAFFPGQPVAHRIFLPWPTAMVVGDGDVAACAGQGALHLFRLDGDRILTTSIPVVAARNLSVTVHGDKVYVLAGETLFRVEVSALDFASTPTAQAIAFDPLVGEGQRDDEAAVVAFALPESILLDHPRFKRLRVPRVAGQYADLEKGDRVVLDDVQEEMPTIFRVRAMHKVGAAPSVRPPPPPAIQLDAPTFEEPSRPASAVPRQPDSQILLALATRHHFLAPLLLVRLLQLNEADLVFARWLRRVYLGDIEVRSSAADWDADPNLLAFLGLGNGDEYSLYIYPPWCAPADQPAREPPVVEFFHETGFAELRALTFDAFFDWLLEQAIELEEDETTRDKTRELVAKIRERLDFPRGQRDLGVAPEWLPKEDEPTVAPARGLLASVSRFFSSASSSAPGVKDDPRMRLALSLEAKGDLVAAERVWLRAHLLDRGYANADATIAASALRRLYAQLGWTFALENLGDANA